jgi:hypothetical protein
MIQLIGGEMPDWVEDRPAAGGALLDYVTDQIPGGASVLVAGPHDDRLIDALATRTRLTVLVRSQPEAIKLDARGVTVRCGTLTKVTDTDRYDVVVALDGLGRLCSVEGPQLDWVESLRALCTTLRPGGALLLTVENELGVHRLVDPSSATSAQGNGDWLPLGEFDTKPGNPNRLTELLLSDGLSIDWLGAVWPLPGAPTLIATPNALRDGPVDALAATTAGVVARAYADRDVLSDPRRLAAAAVRGGLAAEFAAGWLVVAHRAPRPLTTLILPAVLLGDGPVTELAPDADGTWVRRSLRGGGTSESLPTGRLLEELLLGACLRHDLPLVRRLVTGWMAALPAAAADNVVVHADAYAILDPTRPADGDVLRRFAQTLLGGGYAHPWPAATDVRTLTAVLHAAAGMSDVMPNPPDTPADENLPLPESRREHHEQLRALRRQLDDAAARARWFERELDRRDKELRKLRLQVAAFSGTVGFRVAKLGAGAARKVRKRLRKGLS